MWNNDKSLFQSNIKRVFYECDLYDKVKSNSGMVLLIGILGFLLDSVTN